MKKILSLILSILMIFSLVACGTTEAPETTTEAPETATVKFGAGAAAGLKTNDDKGTGTLEMSYAAVLVDAEGKIAAVELDAMSMETAFADGKVTAVNDNSLKSKYEQKEAYGMVAYAGAKLEWYAQADALETVLVGKTLDQAKALVVDGYKGTDEVINAGCTIGINDLILAVENAYNNAKAEVRADAKLSIAGYGTQTPKDADADAAAQNKLEAYMAAAAKDADGKVLAMASDCMNGNFKLNEGKVETFDCNATQTKRQQGDNYGMVAYAGAKAEWYAQADSFDAACVGKTAAEIAGITAEAAGCTIAIDGLVAAAAKL